MNCSMTWRCSRSAIVGEIVVGPLIESGDPAVAVAQHPVRDEQLAKLIGEVGRRQLVEGIVIELNASVHKIGEHGGDGGTS